MRCLVPGTRYLKPGPAPAGGNNDRSGPVGVGMTSLAIRTIEALRQAPGQRAEISLASLHAALGVTR